MQAHIPVDLFNPGQVFACLGFLEAADILIGEAEGGFDWSDPANVRFRLRANGDRNPFEGVLSFLAHAEICRLVPPGYADPPPKKNKKAEEPEGAETAEEQVSLLDKPKACETFPTKEAEPMTLPIRLTGVVNGISKSLGLGHWADGSDRNAFKLYSGNRPAARIAKAMLHGTLGKTTKTQPNGELETRGLRQLWDESREALIKQPFDVLTSMGGSFNFDPRGAWTAIDAGYSPNDQGHGVAASPVVEILAAIGLEHARPDEYDRREVRYAIWTEDLPPMLARVALSATSLPFTLRCFRFTLDLSGKNKVVTFATEETLS